MANSNAQRANNNKRSASCKGKQTRKRTAAPAVKEEAGKKAVKATAQETEYTEGTNDVAWYAHSPQLLRDAASLNFSTRTGGSLGFGANTMLTADQDLNAVPGIMTIHYNECLGGQCHVIDPSNAVNSAAKNIYSNVRYAQSGHSNYEAPDLMMGILAATDIFSAISFGIRAYGIARVWDQKNEYTPTALLTAMGFDAADVLSHMADLRYGLNNAIAKASVVWVPKNISIVARRYWMNANIYRDSDSVRSQFYMYVPTHFYKFSPKTSTTGSSLDIVTVPQASMTVTQYLALLDSMLDPIMSDEDMGIMFGDILKAYGKENLYFLDFIDENYTVIPVYNPEVLTQIHNAKCVPVSPAKVVQDTNGTIYHEPFVLYSATYYGQTTGNWLLDFENQIPEPADIMVASRMLAYSSLAYDSTNSRWYAAGLIAGTEFPTYFKVWYYNDSRVLTGQQIWSCYAGTNNAARIERYGRFDKFHQRPLIMWGETSGSGANLVFNQECLLGDLDVYTTVEPITLTKMHDTAVLSEYDVPLIL